MKSHPHLCDLVIQISQWDRKISHTFQATKARDKILPIDEVNASNVNAYLINTTAGRCCKTKH